MKITFADGKVLKLKTHRPPEGWRRLLKTRVRYYAADALAVTAAKSGQDRDLRPQGQAHLTPLPIIPAPRGCSSVG